MTVYPIRFPRVSTGRRLLMRTPLNGTTYTLEWLFNARAQTWTLHFRDANNDPILSGIAVRADYPLLVRTSDTRRPLGQLYVLDTSGQGQDPGPNDLGARHQLVYDDEQEDA